jgi:signal transduction histidine kinase
MSKKSEKLNWKALFETGKVTRDLQRAIIEYQKFELLNKILPDIFHKLKNKLTPIMGYSQLLLLKITDNETRNKLERIEKNSGELNQLLDRLRDYFKSGKSRQSRININDIIAGLDSFFSAITKKHKIMVETDLDDNIPETNLVYGQIEMLVTNVMDNAVQAINNRSDKTNSGVIKISTCLDGEEVQLRIIDNGIGMNPETLSRIWLPFYSEFSHGMGIGLLVCETIISNHEGRFQVHSCQGVGTDFKFYFKLNR